ncbi:MAG TPA: DUF502 domain-containing protein [Symbiobacteriaceae bacterium]|nr:DUF502 domain-containing protein [Symbiobacteriaceae bacterium]
MILRKVRNWMLAGLIVLLPVWLTFAMVWWVFSSLDQAVSGPLRQYFQVPLPGVGVLLAFVLTLLVGWLTTVFVGQRLLDLGERIMLRLPFVRPIYSAVKQVTEAVIGRKDRAFSRVVLLEYPRPEVYCLGFVAGELPGTDLIRLWVAQGPSPSAGPVIVVPADQTVLLPMTVEDGLKLIISAGVLVPRETDVTAMADAVAELRRRRLQRVAAQ